MKIILYYSDWCKSGQDQFKKQKIKVLFTAEVFRQEATDRWNLPKNHLT